MVDLVSALHAAADQRGVDVGSIFEQIVMTAYQDLLQPGDCAVDVGAHKGFHLFPMAEAVGSKGKIYAFEPISHLCNALKRKVNKHGFKQVKLFNLALGAVAETATFSYFENRPAFSGLQQRQTPFDPVEGGLQQITVNCRQLDQKMPWFRKVSFMKMDIEGGEYRALLGAEKTLAKSRPIIIFEHGQRQSARDYGYSADEFFSLFERHDMQLYVLTGEPYTRDNWCKLFNCWEFVALPREKSHLIDRFEGYCRKVLNDTPRPA